MKKDTAMNPTQRTLYDICRGSPRLYQEIERLVQTGMPTEEIVAVVHSRHERVIVGLVRATAKEIRERNE